MKSTDITVEILKDIRQELRDTNARLHQGLREVREDVRSLREDTNVRFDAMTRRLVESEVRTATAMTALSGDVRELTAFLRAQGDLRPRVERCERDIADLQSKRRPGA